MEFIATYLAGDACSFRGFGKYRSPFDKIKQHPSLSVIMTKFGYTYKETSDTYR